MSGVKDGVADGADEDWANVASMWIMTAADSPLCVIVSGGGGNNSVNVEGSGGLTTGGMVEVVIM